MFGVISTFIYKVSIELFELRARVVAKETLSNQIILSEVKLSKGRPSY